MAQSIESTNPPDTHATLTRYTEESPMPNRPDRASRTIRHTYTEFERLKMGEELASAHARLEDIAAEEAVVKAQFKERRVGVENTISKNSREIQNGWTMQTVDCEVRYDDPNPNEVSYVRIDTGEVVETRPFTASERQADLPLGDGTISIEAVPAEESQANAAEFFGKVADIVGPEETEAIKAEVEAAPDPEVTNKKKRADEKKAVSDATKRLAEL